MSLFNKTLRLRQQALGPTHARSYESQVRVSEKMIYLYSEQQAIAPTIIYRARSAMKGLDVYIAARGELHIHRHKQHNPSCAYFCVPLY